MVNESGDTTRGDVANALQMIVLFRAAYAEDWKSAKADLFTMLDAVEGRLRSALGGLRLGEPAAVVAGVSIAPPPEIPWHELDIHGIPAGTFPPGAQVFQGTVPDGHLMAVTFGGEMGPRGRPGISMTLVHVQSELHREPGRLVTFAEAVSTVRSLWPAGTFAGIVIGSSETDALPPALFMSEVYPSQLAKAGASRIWTPEQG